MFHHRLETRTSPWSSKYVAHGSLRMPLHPEDTRCNKAHALKTQVDKCTEQLNAPSYLYENHLDGIIASCFRQPRETLKSYGQKVGAPWQVHICSHIYKYICTQYLTASRTRMQRVAVIKYVDSQRSYACSLCELKDGSQGQSIQHTQNKSSDCSEGAIAHRRYYRIVTAEDKPTKPQLRHSAVKSGSDLSTHHK